MKSKKVLTVISAAVITGSIYTSEMYMVKKVEDTNKKYTQLESKYRNTLAINKVQLKENAESQAALKEAFGKLQKQNQQIKNLEDDNGQLQEEKKLLIEKLRQETGEWKEFKLTYYDANEPSTGKNPGDSGYGVTASGRKVQQGITIAVDPNVIPLDSWVLIKFPDGHIEKRRADDTGGLIKGQHIDYYVSSASLSMGVKTVKVKILKGEE